VRGGSPNIQENRREAWESIHAHIRNATRESDSRWAEGESKSAKEDALESRTFRIKKAKSWGMEVKRSIMSWEMYYENEREGKT